MYRAGPGMIPRVQRVTDPCYNNVLNQENDVSAGYLCGDWDNISNNDNKNVFLTSCFYNSSEKPFVPLNQDCANNPGSISCSNIEYVGTLTLRGHAIDLVVPLCSNLTVR